MYMCLCPLPRKNVNKGQAHIGLNFMKDCDNEYMYVPCGRCSECVAAKQNDFVQRITAESKYNHLFFATLTYDNKHLPRITIEVPVPKYDKNSIVCDSDLSQFDSSQHHNSILELNDLQKDLFGSLEFDSSERILPFDIVDEDPLSVEEELFGSDDQNSGSLSGDYLPDDSDEVEFQPIEFTYADIHDIQLLMKRVRDNNPLDGRCIRYACVSELGKQNGRPHFHVLFLVEHRPEDFLSQGQVDKNVMLGLERRLRECVRKYWAVNVGTRKDPVYEPAFTYARKFRFGRVYTNFDLHWVDPSLTPSTGTSNVAFYVSKYIMKGSERDVRRQRFLKLNLSPDEYESVWRVIRCRMTCSKGLGIDARCETIEREVVEHLPADVYADSLTRYLNDCDDLPDPEAIRRLADRSVRTVTSRLLVPNFALVQELRDNLSRDIGEAPGPIFIAADGTHRPLSHYYQRFGYLFTTTDAINIWMNWDPRKDRPSYAKPLEEKQRLESLHKKRLTQIDCHSPFDNISTVDLPENITGYIF